jgi:hypothetical protein
MIEVLESPFREISNSVARWCICIPKIPIWIYLWGLCLVHGGLFYGHLEYFVGMINILLQLGIFCVNLVCFVSIWYICFVAIWYIFIRFGRLYHEKSGNTDLYIETFSLA